MQNEGRERESERAISMPRKGVIAGKTENALQLNCRSPVVLIDQPFTTDRERETLTWQR